MWPLFVSEPGLNKGRCPLLACLEQSTFSERQGLSARDDEMIK